MQEKGRFIGHRFWTYRGHQLFGQRGEVRVDSVSPLEPELYPDSYWLSINVSQILPINLQRRQGNRKLETVRVNIWDLVLEGEEAPNSLSAVATTFLPSTFTDEETTRLADGIELALGKSEELRILFKQRVSEELADDYRCYIAYESYLDLVLERLRSSYYRGREAFFGDLTQIVTASEIYNGEEDELTVKAKSLIEKLKKELKQTLDARPKPKTPPREDIKQTRAQTRQKATVPVTENSTPEGVELTFKAMVR